MFEGMTAFKLGQASIHEDKASIPVYLEYQQGGATSRWIDVLVLERAGRLGNVDDLKADLTQALAAVRG